MIKAYLNLSESRVTIHQNPNCPHAKVGPDEDHRHLLINTDNLSKELSRFGSNGHKFASQPGLNDMWLILDLLDSEFEKAVAAHIRRLVGRHHESFEKSELRLHDC